MRTTDTLKPALDALSDSDYGARTLHGIHEASEALQKRAQALAEQARQARDRGSDSIRSHPLSAVAIAAGVGAGVVLLLGLLARLHTHR